MPRPERSSKPGRAATEQPVAWPRPSARPWKQHAQGQKRKPQSLKFVADGEHKTATGGGIDVPRIERTLRGQTPQTLIFLPLSSFSSPPIHLRHDIFSRSCQPPAMRCKAEFSHRSRRHAARAESIPQCKRRFPHKFNTPEYLPIPYLRHSPHQPPIGDRPRKWLI